MASFLDSFKRLFNAAHKKHSIGIDIGTSSIKIVHLEKVDELAVLKNYAEISLGPRTGLAQGQAVALSPEKTADALRDALREMGVTPEHTLLTIPVGASLLSFANLPQVGKKEFESMVQNEARKYIPVPMSEVSVDWWSLPQEKHALPSLKKKEDTSAPLSTIEVVIAAIHNDVLAKYDAIRRGAGIPLNTSHIEIETFSTLRAAVGRDLRTTLVVDMGASTTKFYIIDGGALKSSHVSSVGGQDITTGLSSSINVPFAEAETIKCTTGMIGEDRGRDVRAVAELFVINLFTEAVRFAEAFGQKHGKRIERIILTGGTSRLAGLSKLVEAKFPGVPVDIAYPFARVDTPAFLDGTLSSLNPVFTPAIGVALKGLEE